MQRIVALHRPEVPRRPMDAYHWRPVTCSGSGKTQTAKQLLEMEGRAHEWGRHTESSIQDIGNWNLSCKKVRS